MMKRPAMRIVGFWSCFSLEYVHWWARHQFHHAWLWRKKREPGGTSHPDLKAFDKLPIKQKVFIERFAREMLDYLRCLSRQEVQELVEVGRLLFEQGCALNEGELVEPLKGIPLVGGGQVKIREDLLNHLAWEHHEAWMTVREWTRSLPDKRLHQPTRKEHQHWDRNNPDHLWDRDRGNIYGLAFALAVMPEDKLRRLLDSCIG